jgi:hopene-associated glycosyltransferase HpnB
MGISSVGLGLAVLSSLSWIHLLIFRGRFWRCDQQLSVSAADEPTVWPTVCAIVPARNEATVLPKSLKSLLKQDYPGQFAVMLVDDQSTDGTGSVAQRTAERCDRTTRLRIMTTSALPTGWSGKLWAVHQGIETVLQQPKPPDYILLTDADILHHSKNLRELITKATSEHLDLVSLMVLLRCRSFWEKLLIPAFIFFFQKLYPFPWVNEPTHPMAAAAGGCILVHRDALTQAGGIEVIRKALIDDCALAAAIKGNATEQMPRGKIWLGLTTKTLSLRPYPSLQTIWEMVARTAFTQLRYSSSLLWVALLGMVLIYLMPPISTALGLICGQGLLLGIGGITWMLMAIAYWPTIRLYQLSPFWTLLMPLIAALYTLMTFDSALRHWQGKGGAWKGRVYFTADVK